MRKYKKIQIVLGIAATFLLPLLDAYFDYYIFMEADFLSAQSKFEETDLDCFLVSKKQNIAAFTGFSYNFRAANILIKDFSFFSFQVTIPQVRSLVLRC
jgi:hypothetical protein